MTLSPIFKGRPPMSIPSSAEYTAILRFDVDSGPYGSQLDNILNHAYSDGIMERPITITTATTFVLTLLKSR